MLVVLGPKQMEDSYTLIIITVFYLTVFVTGIIGNISVCNVILRSSHLHTAMNYYLVSLACADLMIIILGNIDPPPRSSLTCCTMKVFLMNC